jgi:hypothetical protein
MFDSRVKNQNLKIMQTISKIPPSEPTLSKNYVWIRTGTIKKIKIMIYQKKNALKRKKKKRHDRVGKFVE